MAKTPIRRQIYQLLTPVAVELREPVPAPIRVLTNETVERAPERLAPEMFEQYCREQIASASTPSERIAAERLSMRLYESGMIRRRLLTIVAE